YTLKNKSEERVRIAITDKDGKAVRELDGGREAGLNRVVWDLRSRSLIAGQGEGGAGGGEAGEAGGGGFGFGGGGVGLGGGALRVEPGEYTVKVTAGKNEQSRKVVVTEDPRIEISAEDRIARRKALDQLAPMAAAATQGARSVTGLRTALGGVLEGWK